MKEIDIFILHGISKKINLPDLFEFGINVKDLIDAHYSVNVYPIEYSNLLDKRQTEIYKRQIKTHRWRKSCFFASYFAADALASYHKERPLEEGDFVFDLWRLLEANYDMIHHIRPDSMKVMIAHSLGSQYALSFCWRRRIDYLVTMGSPIDWYSSAFKSCEYPPMVKLWSNFYNRYDPIHTTCKHFGNKVEDVDVTTFLPFMLMAHSSYWKNSTVHKHIAKRIVSLIEDQAG